MATVEGILIAATRKTMTKTILNSLLGTILDTYINGNKNILSLN